MMHKDCQAALVSFSLVSCAAVLLFIAGCESKPVGATANSATPTSTNPANSAIKDAANNSAAKPKPAMRPGAKTKVLSAAGDKPYDKTFDDLRFDMKVGDTFRRSMLTKPIEAMSGQRIRIRGYIVPTSQKSGIQTFVLVRDNQECCFGAGAALYDCILVDMQKGKTAEYSIRPVAAEGIFEIRDFVIGDQHLAIYHMDAETVGGS
jgi:hypothetical protein